MTRSSLLLAMVFPLVAAGPFVSACMVESTPPASAPPPAPYASSVAPPPATVATAAPTAAPPVTPAPPSVADAGVVSTPAPAPSPAPPAATGGGSGPPAADPQYRACGVDADCVAVARVGCCKNGWNEAVAASQKDAYVKGFKCPEARPICPMFMVHDTRAPLCDTATHLCAMTPGEDIHCGGFNNNPHKCPDGFKCQHAIKNPDIPGQCVKTN